MFTGIVDPIGTVLTVTPRPDRLVLELGNPWGDLVLGESVAVDGACLTVAEVSAEKFTVEVVATTIERTTFQAFKAGRRVNLERATRLGDRLGGHIVQGHVDGVGTVLSTRLVGDTSLVEVELPPEVAQVTIPLGSITVNGVSLTVNSLPDPGVVQLSLVPFTLNHTTLGELRPGERVHLEGDLIGKHVRHQVDMWQHKGEGR